MAWQTPKMAQEIADWLNDESLGITPDDIVVHIVKLDYGMKGKDPIENVRFYTKEKPNVAVGIRKSQVSQMLPERFAEQQIRVYSKRRDRPALVALQDAFYEWCKASKCCTPKGVSCHPEMTPSGTPRKRRVVEGGMGGGETAVGASTTVAFAPSPLGAARSSNWQTSGSAVAAATADSDSDDEP